MCQAAGGLLVNIIMHNNYSELFHSLELQLREVNGERASQLWFSFLFVCFCAFGKQNKKQLPRLASFQKKIQSEFSLPGNSGDASLESIPPPSPFVALNFWLCSIADAVPCASGHAGHYGGDVLCGHFFTGSAQRPLL